MDIPTPAEFHSRCAEFCERHGIAPTRFGREAVGEASFLKALEAGRSPGLALARKAIEYMQRIEAERLAAEGERA